MSAQAAGPETLGHLSDPPPEDDPNSKRAKSITGKSPMRIAVGRLARDKIAVVCLAVVFFFILVALFAGAICSFFNVSTDTVLATTRVDMLNGGLPKTGPPLHGYDPAHPMGIAPQSGDDNLAYWVYGARTSLMLAGLATLFASVTGVAAGLMAGFLGGFVDKVISFVTDFFLTVPYLLAALTIAPIITSASRPPPTTRRSRSSSSSSCSQCSGGWVWPA